ncbi:MAG TPA: NAD-dependent epimerase/dehydratase family protein [Candidatus Limnocylindrales bacterium]|nr:NAD-dependent epimerase/dehydratase family protein [Candidatus Limnocylindrales bacterium]
MSRVFVTGAAGFIGRAVVRRLRERGDEVTAIVRDPTRATALTDLGVRLVAGDLGSAATIREPMAGCDGAIHLAGSYRVGITPAERPAMFEMNVAVTARVFDAAIEVGIPRIVHISTANVLGDTNGRLVNETHVRDPADGFLSYYDETKVEAHRSAETRIAAGAPILIAMPGFAYGPGDHAAIGSQLKAAFDGRAPAIVLGDMGISVVHVDDLAAGILAVHDRGRIGESYLLTGECLTLADAMGVAARAAGRRPPRLHVSTALLRIAEPLAQLAMQLGILEFDLAETLRAGDNVTYWATHGKATAELGYAPRPLSQGAVDAFGHG